MDVGTCEVVVMVSKKEDDCPDVRYIVGVKKMTAAEVREEQAEKKLLEE